MPSRVRVAIFLVRAWSEDDSFRARVKRCTDIDVEPAVELLTASPDELGEYFAVWLREVTREG